MGGALLCWVGASDLRAAAGEAGAGDGPIAQAVAARSFEHVVLLNNYPQQQVAAYVAWLRARTDADVAVRQEVLSSPVHYGDIYRAATTAAGWALEKLGAATKLTFHLSPGTPAMASIWIILAKTRFEAELIESSKEHGVTTAEIPFEMSAEFVPSLMRRADRELERLSGGLRPDEPAFGDILGRSEAMKRLVRQARVAAPHSAPILIEGESGTGKELLAAAIHNASPRQGKPLVVVNCGAIPEDLVEAQFFGYMKGAFTGAAAEHAGFFEQAHEGTLFLDEIGELPLEAQVKLLRVLQEKKVRRINGKAEIPADVRVIAATNRTLLTEVAEDRFREDLYFRLAVLVLRTPPLREREGDVGLLCDHVLQKLNAEAGGRPGAIQKKLSPGARNVLLRHTWPGNVRELEATLLRAVVWSKGPVIEATDASEALLVAPTRRGGEILGRPLGNGFSLEETLSEVVRHYLSRARDEAHGQKTKAASLIGFRNYQTLTNWAKKHGVKV